MQTTVIRALLGAAFATAALAALPAGTAAADSSCERGAFCAWVDVDYQGRQENYATGEADLSITGMDARISSVTNNTGENWCLYDQIDYRGQHRVIPAGKSFHNLEEIDFNDKTMSLQPCRQ